MKMEAHHILHDRVQWSARKEAHALRSMPALIQRIDHDSHRELHANVPAVPVLGFHALRHTLNAFEPGRTANQNIDNLLVAMEAARDHPRAHDIERNLADLAIIAVDLQRPFIRAGQLRSVR